MIPGSPPDLIATMRRIERAAVIMKRSLADGQATTGKSALDKIEYEARDAIRHATAYAERHPDD